MQRANRSIHESEGFRAHDFLTNRAGWKVKASKLTSNLKEGRTGWKKVITTLAAPTRLRVAVPEQLTLDFSLEAAFRSLAEQWEDETEHISNLKKAIAHPAYQQIIGMGKVAPDQVVSLLLRRLEETHNHWLVALHEITKQDPAPDGANFEEAVQAWLNWGRSRGRLT